MSDIPASLAGHPWAAAKNFLGLDPAVSRWADSRAVVLPIPYEATVSWGTGTRFGPDAILEASRYVELYDEEMDAEPYSHGICTLPAIELTAEGPQAAVAQLRRLYDELLEAAGERFVIGLGGEHSISSAPAWAWAERLKGDLSILHLDAHSDLRESYRGTPWSHAAVMRRILERTDRIVSVGIRALTAEERKVIRERGLVTIFAHQMREDGWVEHALGGLGENVYLTFDVDFFDPALVPATGAPEPGGGSWWQALDLLRAVFRERNVVGADIVELAPRRGAAASDMLVAKLAYKMVGYLTSK